MNKFPKWHIRHYPDGLLRGMTVVSDENHRDVCSVLSCENAESIACLIAAAPDLLAALRMVCDSGVALAPAIESAMTAAIAKAEGK